jgi:hypothetical protein
MPRDQLNASLEALSGEDRRWVTAYFVLLIVVFATALLVDVWLVTTRTHGVWLLSTVALVVLGLVRMMMSRWRELVTVDVTLALISSLSPGTVDSLLQIMLRRIQ